MLDSLKKEVQKWINVLILFVYPECSAAISKIRNTACHAFLFMLIDSSCKVKIMRLLLLAV